MLIELKDSVHRGVEFLISMSEVTKRAIEFEKQAWVLKARNLSGNSRYFNSVWFEEEAMVLFEDIDA